MSSKVLEKPWGKSLNCAGWKKNDECIFRSKWKSFSNLIEMKSKLLMKTFVDFMHELVPIITIFVDKHFKKKHWIIKVLKSKIADKKNVHQ